MRKGVIRARDDQAVVDQPRAPRRGDVAADKAVVMRIVLRVDGRLRVDRPESAACSRRRRTHPREPGPGRLAAADETIDPARSRGLVRQEEGPRVDRAGGGEANYATEGAVLSAFWNAVESAAAMGVVVGRL